MQRNVVVAFLASPSDLEDERALVRENVERVNRIFGRTLGWHIELRGWEDVLPDYRRPQDLINQDVDECDLFIGMLWTRWGTPTAHFASGFEEEFDRVRARWLRTKGPHIWLMFKKVDPEREKDPGPQLQQVLTFKQQQIERNELLFKEFDTPEQFATLIQEMLSEFLLRQAHQQSEQEEGKLNKSPETPPAAADAVTEPLQPQARPRGENDGELIELLRRTAQCLREHPDNLDLTLSECTRLVVAATALFSPLHASELLGIHELHIAYRNRQTWQHTSAELLLLLRTMVANSSGLYPGWYWSRSDSADEIHSRITYLARFDRKDDVRRGAIAMCLELQIPLTRDDMEALLRETKEPALSDAIRLVKRSGGAAAEALLEPLITDSRAAVREAAAAAFYDLKFARDPAGAVRDYIAAGAKPTTWLTKERARENIPFDAGYLKELLARPEAHIRIFAGEWLRHTGSLDSPGWQKLLDDAEAKVKEIAVEALIDRGEAFDWARLEKLFPSPPRGTGAHGLLGLALLPTVSKEALRRRQIERKAPDVLLQNLDFYDLNSVIAYDVICEKDFRLIEHRIRRDLDAEFLTLKQESDQKLRDVLGAAAESALSRWEAKTIETLQNAFIAKALKHLVHRAEPEDARFARRFITRLRFPEVVSASARLLAFVGNADDVDLLLSARNELSSKDLTVVITGAVALARNKVALLHQCFEKDESIWRSASVVSRLLEQITEAERRVLAVEMLSSKFDSIRTRGVAALAQIVPFDEIQQILNQYLSLETYYYDAVTWLDRLLYAPVPVRDRYREQLVGPPG